VKKVLWVKFGWSDYYRGGLVDGNFGWLNDNKGKKNEGRGHEAFNFMPGLDGTYYCYVPPQKKEYAPSNDEPNGWTVICLAKNPKFTGIHVVGWYEDATLHGEWFVPPAETVDMQGDVSLPPTHDRSYCITSRTAYFIPPEHRTMPFSDFSIKQGKYSFLKGPGVDTNNNKKRVLKLIESRLKAMTAVAIKNPNDRNLPDPELDSVDPLKGFGTAEDRKKVEKAAEWAAIKHYKTKGYTCERVTHLPCGYDFIFAKGREVLHVEVKGTASPSPRFFLTRNEHRKGLQSNPAWRLVMVTSALTDTPDITEYDAAELKRAFDLEPYVYIASFIPKPKN